MPANEIRLEDIGTIFEITLMDDTEVVDISGATLMQIRFAKPDGTIMLKTAVHTTNGSDGKLQYTTILNDLDQVGIWQKQAYIELPTGKWNSDIDKFKVHDNLFE